MTENKELIIKDTIKPAVIFSEGGSKDMLERLGKIARSNVYDMETKKGQNELRSDAMKISKFRTRFNEQREMLLSDMRVATKAINVEWKDVIEPFLLDLQEEIRKPLTEIEEATKARLQAIDDRIEKIIRVAGDISAEWDTGAVADMERTLIAIEKVSLTDGSWGKRLEDAISAREVAISSIKGSIAKAKAAIDTATELARLQAEAEEKAEQDRDDAIKREAEERVRKEAEEATAKAEAERLAAIAEKEAAEQRAKDAEEREVEQKRSAEKAVIDADKLKRFELEQAAEREKRSAKKAAEAERERIAEEARVAAEEVAAREADVEHRKTINNAALNALRSECGFDYVEAKAVVASIIDGKIPNVRIEY